ncbi:ribosomal protein S16 domain-containing protein [Hyaloraphidium curvatum]|nr:ribosomal protein S16 domain-containing protein [Hyaloraphidium curvatum]
MRQLVKIRLARWGISKNPFYGIVASHVRWSRDGKHMERLGSYNPIPDRDGKKHLTLNIERIKHWLVSGAVPSERVSWLLAIAGILPPSPKHLRNMGQEPPAPDMSAYLSRRAAPKPKKEEQAKGRKK